MYVAVVNEVNKDGCLLGLLESSHTDSSQFVPPLLVFSDLAQHVIFAHY